MVYAGATQVRSFPFDALQHVEQAKVATDPIGTVIHPRAAQSQVAIMPNARLIQARNRG